MSLPLTKLIIKKKKKKPRLKDPNTSNYNEFNVLYPSSNVYKKQKYLISLPETTYFFIHEGILIILLLIKILNR